MAVAGADVGGAGTGAGAGAVPGAAGRAAQSVPIIDVLVRPFGPWVRLVDRSTLRADLIVGIFGALLVLPQGFAFATLAGLPPE